MVCEERTRAELSNIELYDRKLNAFVTVFSGDHGLAVARARELDGRLASKGSRRSPPLIGVPVTVKDNVFLSAFPTTNGSACFRDFVPATNAEIVDRLLGAGCVPLGKTNMQELALGVTATGAYGGPIGNPVDPSRVSGGSSGGSAVSVALANGPMFSVGSDTGGSVRIPAALCGVCGFKPSQGVLPIGGVFPLGPSLDHLGLLTRTMPDMAFAFQALSGVPTLRNERPRLGIPTGYFTEGMDRTVSKAFWSAVDSLRSSGEFVVVDVPVKKDLTRYSRARSAIMLREAAWFYEELIRSPKMRRAMHRDVLTLMDRGLRTGMIQYMQAMNLRADSVREMPQLLAGVDALIMPTCLIVAPRIDEALGNETGLIRTLLLRNTELFNLTGLPALTIPIRKRGGRMPVAIQVVGRYGDDGQVVGTSEKIWGALPS
jgi:aspartyl-tRNA(Asn)/glutamyl-tRNA(Gln) amidotransferase subunit A